MKKEKYQIPEMELLMLGQEDVIRTSITITDDNDIRFDDNTISMTQWN